MTTVRAPGRVNLIGEHTDYSGGYCLPVAIDRECRIHSEADESHVVTAHSAQLAGRVEVSIDDGSPHPDSPPWGTFVAGTVQVLRELGHVLGGAHLEIDSTVPAGSGLSSSSALSIALVLTLLPVDAAERADRRALASLALAAEVRATGVPGGLLDQMASLYGVADHALLLDCRSLSVDPVPLPPDLAILVIHSGVPRDLATSEYAQRRAACEAIAARIGVAMLRDATFEQVADDPIGRHVVTENARVLEFAAALQRGDIEALGPLLVASHVSLRDDFAVSTPELDLLVDSFMEHGAIGARLTGAGFGGCVIALAPKPDADHCLSAAMRSYEIRTRRHPMGFVARSADGAGPLG